MKASTSSHINVSFSMGSIASCGVMKTPSCIIPTLMLGKSKSVVFEDLSEAFDVREQARF